MKKFIIAATIILIGVGGATWKVHYKTVQDARTQLARESEIDNSIARYKDDVAFLGEAYQKLTDDTAWKTVPVDLAAVTEEVGSVADIVGSSIYVVTYDAEDRLVGLKKIANVDDVAELPVKAKAAGNCLVRLDLDTQDVAGVIEAIQSMALPVARYDADYYKSELAVYLWVLGGDFGE